MNEAILIDVCMATFRRDSVVETLRSLAAQKLPLGVKLRVIVADNDETPSARKAVEQAAAALNLDAIYVHAPARNISIARNATLDASTGDFVAFIDDDETADENWLATALSHLKAHQVDGVFGPAIAQYPDDAPQWMVDKNHHSNIPQRRGGKVLTGHTCNALIKRDTIGETRFLLEVGQSGGEDDEFFSRLYRQGARYEIADEALTFEDVLPQRMSYEWLSTRQYRSGQTYGRYLPPSRLKRSLYAGLTSLKVLFCYGMAGINLASPSAKNRWLLRGRFHMGGIAGSFGQPPKTLYGQNG